MYNFHVHDYVFEYSSGSFTDYLVWLLITAVVSLFAMTNDQMMCFLGVCKDYMSYILDDIYIYISICCDIYCNMLAYCSSQILCKCCHCLTILMTNFKKMPFVLWLPFFSNSVPLIARQKLHIISVIGFLVKTTWLPWLTQKYSVLMSSSWNFHYDFQSKPFILSPGFLSFGDWCFKEFGSREMLPD